MWNCGVFVNREKGENDMAESLGMLLILGLLSNYIFTKMKLPELLGMLLLGIVLGPYGLKLLDPTLLKVSADFRQLWAPCLLL